MTWTRGSMAVTRTSTGTGGPPAAGVTSARSMDARKEPVVSWLEASMGARYRIMVTDPGRSRTAAPGGGSSTSMATAPGQVRSLPESVTPAYSTTARPIAASFSGQLRSRKSSSRLTRPHPPTATRRHRERRPRRVPAGPPARRHAGGWRRVHPDGRRRHGRAPMTDRRQHPRACAHAVGGAPGVACHARTGHPAPRCRPPPGRRRRKGRAAPRARSAAAPRRGRATSGRAARGRSTPVSSLTTMTTASVCSVTPMAARCRVPVRSRWTADLGQRQDRTRGQDATAPHDDRPVMERRAAREDGRQQLLAQVGMEHHARLGGVLQARLAFDDDEGTGRATERAAAVRASVRAMPFGETRRTRWCECPAHGPDPADPLQTPPQLWLEDDHERQQPHHRARLQDARTAAAGPATGPGRRCRTARWRR